MPKHKTRKTKNGETTSTYYTCYLPTTIINYLGYNDKIYYKTEATRTLLSPTPTEDEYTIHKNQTISIPQKYFKPEGYKELLYIIDMNKSTVTPHVTIKLK